MLERIARYGRGNFTILNLDGRLILHERESTELLVIGIVQSRIDIHGAARERDFASHTAKGSVRLGHQQYRPPFQCTAGDSDLGRIENPNGITKIPAEQVAFVDRDSCVCSVSADCKHGLRSRCVCRIIQRNVVERDVIIAVADIERSTRTGGTNNIQVVQRKFIFNALPRPAYNVQSVIADRRRKCMIVSVDGERFSCDLIPNTGAFRESTKRTFHGI